MRRQQLRDYVVNQQFRRDIFIKGGYDKGDRKNLPMEEWKQPFYPLDRHVPTEPCHLLYVRAWKRIEDGDLPGA